MHDELTRSDLQKMQEEIDYRVQVLRPKLIEDVQTARAFGLTGDAAQDLVETVKAVYQATEAWGGRGPGPGGPGGPPPPR